MTTIFDLATRAPFCLVVPVYKLETLACSKEGNGPGRERWTSVFCASTPGCVLDQNDYELFSRDMNELISAYRELCRSLNQSGIAAVLDELSRRIFDKAERCVTVEDINCICPRVWRLDRAKDLAHILIDIAWARGPTAVLIRNLEILAHRATDLQEHLTALDGPPRRFSQDDESAAALADRLAVDLFDAAEQLHIAMAEQDAYSLH